MFISLQLAVEGDNKTWLLKITVRKQYVIDLYNTCLFHCSWQWKVTIKHDF